MPQAFPVKTRKYGTCAIFSPMYQGSPRVSAWARSNGVPGRQPSGCYAQGPWVVGALVNNRWSCAGDDNRAEVNQLLQSCVNDNLGHGVSLRSSPIIPANWEADSDNVWTVPMGSVVAQVLRVGRQPIHLLLAGFDNLERPDNAAEWTFMRNGPRRTTASAICVPGSTASSWKSWSWRVRPRRCSFIRWSTPPASTPSLRHVEYRDPAMARGTLSRTGTIHPVSPHAVSGL